MRRRVLASLAKSGYTAKDYAQDGLIAMWDGIENAGWGVHSETTETIDLVGDNGVASGYSSHAENGMVFNGTKDVIVNIDSAVERSLISGLFSLEIVFPDGWLVSSWKYALGLHYDDEWMKFSARRDNRNASFILSKSLNTNFTDSLVKMSLVSHGDGTADCYYNGLKFSWDGITYPSQIINKYIGFGCLPGLPSVRMTGKIGAVRFYSNDISEINLGLNDEIDKARFNLPDVT